MRFKDLIGHKDLSEYIVNTVKSGKISHAILLYGFPGTGKLAIAIAFARYLCCTNKENGDSCTVCPSCKKFEKLVHPDLHFVFPVIKESGKKAVSDNYIHQWREMVLKDPYFSLNEWMETIGSGNKQANIYVEESSEILKKLNLKTYESDYKSMIIWLPEKMNISCANKLLKILEEPPDKTVFLLISDNRELVLPTIISRTQPLKVNGISKQDLYDSLKANFNIDDEELEYIVNLSNGSYLAAKNYINASEETKYNFENFTNFMRLAYGRKISEIIDWSAEMSRVGREKQKSFLSYSLRFLRENFIYGVNKNSQSNYMLKMELEFAVKFSPFINDKNIFTIVDEFEKSHYHIERNGNAKIILSDLSFKIMRVIR